MVGSVEPRRQTGCLSGIVVAMPKVPQEHLERRRRQILDAAMSLFSRDGFHATTMQQITAASGVSAGAVYHYFPTKQSLVDATAQAMAVAYRAPLAALLGDGSGHVPDPAEVIEAITGAMAAIHDGEIDFTRIGIFMWAEALRDPRAMKSLQAFQRALREGLAPLVRAWQQTGVVDPGASVDEVAAALYGLIPGFTLQLNMLGDVTADGYARGATALSGPRRDHGTRARPHPVGGG